MRSFGIMPPTGGHWGYTVSTGFPPVWFQLNPVCCVWILKPFPCLSVPESVWASQPSLKHRGKRSSKGKGRKSEQSSQDKPALPPTGQADTSVISLYLKFLFKYQNFFLKIKFFFFQSGGGKSGTAYTGIGRFGHQSNLCPSQCGYIHSSGRGQA